MRKIIFSFLFVMCLAAISFGQSAKVSGKELDILTGSEWKGTLSYLDYSSGKKISIPSNLIVMRSKDEKSAWIFDYLYPDEPKANSKGTITLADKGRTFDGKKVVEKTKLPNKMIRIIAEKSGQDSGKNAVLRYTYLLSKTSFSLKKEVRYEEGGDFFLRNEYSWKR